MVSSASEIGTLVSLYRTLKKYSTPPVQTPQTATSDSHAIINFLPKIQREAFLRLLDQLMSETDVRVQVEKKILSLIAKFDQDISVEGRGFFIDQKV